MAVVRLNPLKNMIFAVSFPLTWLTRRVPSATRPVQINNHLNTGIVL